MEKDSEPPDGHDRSQRISNLVKTVEHQDESGILLGPEPNNGIRGHCNLSVIDKYIQGKGYPVFVRTRKDDHTIPYDESSRIKAGYMHTPTEIGELKTILGKNGAYASWGTEDLRAVMGPDGNIHMTGLSFDGKNARIAYYITSTDLTGIQYIGTISPKISLKRAQEIVGKNSIYYEPITRALEGTKKFGKKGKLIQVKDAAPYFHGKYGRGMKLFGRIEPCIQTHTLRQDDSHINPYNLTTYEIIKAVREAGRNDFWEHEIKNLEQRTIMTPEIGKNGKPIQVKIGLGGPPTTIRWTENGLEKEAEVGTMHSVFESKKEFGGRKVDYYLYTGSLFDYDPEHDAVTAKLRDALILPNTKIDRLREYDKKGNLVAVKDIAFPSGLLQDLKNPETAFIYGGGGDQYAKWRSFGVDWFRKAISHAHNRFHILDLLEAA